MDALPSTFNNIVFARQKSFVSVVSVAGCGNGFFSGTAMGQSLVMTAEHVIRSSVATGTVQIVVPSVNMVIGRIVFVDEGADISVVMIPSDSIPGELVEFSYVQNENDRDLVMLGHFTKGQSVIIDPGTSHGFARVNFTRNNIDYIGVSFTAKCGNSGSCFRC